METKVLAIVVSDICTHALTRFHPPVSRILLLVIRECPVLLLFYFLKPPFILILLLFCLRRSTIQLL